MNPCCRCGRNIRFISCFDLKGEEVNRSVDVLCRDGGFRHSMASHQYRNIMLGAWLSDDGGRLAIHVGPSLIGRYEARVFFGQGNGALEDLSCKLLMKLFMMACKARSRLESRNFRRGGRSVSSFYCITPTTFFLHISH